MLLTSSASFGQGDVASPKIEKVGGNVTITYGDITINRPTSDRGPTLAQITKVVNQVVAKHRDETEGQLEEALIQQLDLLEKILSGVDEMRIEMATGQAATDALINRRLDAIVALLDKGRVGDASDSFDRLYDPWQMAWSASFGFGARMDVAHPSNLIRRYSLNLDKEIVAWPNNVRDYSLSLGGSLFYESGELSGGFASPEPDHEIVERISYVASGLGVAARAKVLMRRSTRVQPFVAGQISVGFSTFDPKSDSTSMESDAAMLLATEVGGGVVFKPFEWLVIVLSLDAIIEPWGKRPVYTYSGVGAAYSSPESKWILGIAPAAALGARWQ